MVERGSLPSEAGFETYLFNQIGEVMKSYVLKVDGEFIGASRDKAELEAMLEELHYPAAMIERVSYLVGHHHTYHDIEGMDYQILVEADFLVNIYEGDMQQSEIVSVREKIFRTRTGKELLDTMFLKK